MIAAHLLPISIKNEEATTTQIRNIITKAAQKFFVDESSLGVVLFDHDANYIPFEVHLPIVVYSEGEIITCKTIPYASEGYVFVIAKASFLTTKIVPTLQCYNRTTMKLNTKKVLVICMKTEYCFSKEYYSQQFQMLWKNFGLVNIIVLTGTVDSDFIFHPIILGYNPFIKNDSHATGVLITFDLESNFEGEFDKRFLNMHGYVLNAVMFPYNISVHPSFLDKPGSIKGGLDLSLRWAFESQFNVHFSIHPPRDGKFHGMSIKGTFTGALIDVINNDVDMALNAKLLKWHDTPKIQFLMPRLDTALIIMVKKKDRIEGWKVIFHLFHWQVWAWYVSTTSIMCFISWVLAKICLKVFILSDHYGNEPSDAVWMVLKSTVSMSVVRLPKLYHDRILMTASLWSSVVIVNLLFGQLFYLIKTKPRTANIDTLQELLESNLPIFTSTESYMSAFDGLQNTSLSKLKDRISIRRFTEAEDGHGYPTKITADYALLHSSTQFQYQLVVEPSEFTESVHILKEFVWQCYLGLYMPIGSVYYKHFYKFSVRIFELGFTIKWMQEYLAFIQESYYRQHPKDLHLKIVSDNLTLMDLKLAFLFLFMGLMISTVCFLFEICFFKYTKLV